MEGRGHRAPLERRRLPLTAADRAIQPPARSPPQVLANPVSDEVDERPGLDPAWLRARGFRPYDEKVQR